MAQRGNVRDKEQAHGERELPYAKRGSMLSSMPEVGAAQVELEDVEVELAGPQRTRTHMQGTAGSGESPCCFLNGD